MMLFDHHIHSKYSAFDSTSEIGDIIRLARESGLGGIAISDHNTIEGSLKATKLSSEDFVIVPSMEISSVEGHIIGLGIREEVRAGLSARETVKEIHDLGGVAIAAHPYDSFRSGVKDLCWKLDFDAIEINGHCLRGNGRAARAAKKHGKPLVGGSDSHALYDIGAICTEVEVGGGASEAKILDGIRGGRCEPVYREGMMSRKMRIMLDQISRGYKKRIRGL